MLEKDPFEGVAEHSLDELSEAVRDEDASVVGKIELRPLHACIARISPRVVDRTCVGVVILDASSLGAWERQHGAASFATLMGRLAQATERMRGSAIRHGDIVAIDADGGDTILVFLRSPRRQKDRARASGEAGAPTAEAVGAVDFESIVSRIKRQLYEPFEATPLWLHEALEQVATGSALLIRNDSVDPRREIYRAIREARIDARVNHREFQRQRHRIVGQMIARQKIQTLYQPIVDMRTRCPLGYEALSRAEQDDAERLGVHLFVAAARAELDGELDQTCRALSIRRRPQLEADGKLFVNTLPPAFYGSTRELDALLEGWEADGLRPDQLVFEITENITRDQLQRILPTVAALRRRGYEFAIDDVGTGASNLQLIADLEPDFIKMDISLTRGIARSLRKQALATYLLELARRCEARLIVEGIEEQADADTCLGLDIHLGQGFLFGRPAPLPTPHGAGTLLGAR